LDYQYLGGLTLQSQILMRDIWDSSFRGDKNELIIQLSEIAKKSLPVLQKLSSDSENILQNLKDSFADRILEMQKSLSKIREHSVDGTVFLIAGVHHLVERENNPFFSLESFYEFLKSRKVVILSAQKEVIKPIDEKANEFYQKIYSFDLNPSLEA
jgi:hypothetical protein